MQKDHNIENKLRELEGMDQPDTSQMDAHWQQMAAVLQPSVLPVKKPWPKWMLNMFSAVGIVALISIAAWFFISKNAAGIKEDIIASDPIRTNGNGDTKDAVPQETVKDTSLVNSTLVAVSHKMSINPSLIYDDQRNGEAKQWTEQDSILGTLKLNVTDCITCPGKKDTAPGITDAERRLKLQNLFAELEKETQQFIIDNSRDTILQFREGTVLLVPAGSVSGMKGVELSAKEFYKTSDIILNHLHTGSNKAQLETGGMIRLNASYQGKQLNVDANRPLTLFMADTARRINEMQLFYGQPDASGQANPSRSNKTNVHGMEDTAMNGTHSYINWLAQGVFFRKAILRREERVLNLVNEPYQVKETEKGKVGYFIVGENNSLSRGELKKMLKEKYGYYKVKLRADFRDHFFVSAKKIRIVTGDINISEYNRSIGDSVWMDKKTAEKYNLVATASRQILSQGEKTMFGGYRIDMDEKGKIIQPQADSTAMKRMDFMLQSVKILDSVEAKYGVDISTLGWINCDRFYTDSRKKIKYTIDLGDGANNYYTMLVFDNIKSVMAGISNGNTVAFENMPVGEPVNIISIGINKQGQIVYAVTHTTTSEQELKGLQFQETSAPGLKDSLSKLDK